MTDPLIAQDFDPLLPEDFDSAHADYARLRSSCPVAHTDAWGGFWALMRYDDVKRAAFHYLGPERRSEGGVHG